MNHDRKHRDELVTASESVKRAALVLLLAALAGSLLDSLAPDPATEEAAVECRDGDVPQAGDVRPMYLGCPGIAMTRRGG
jgi:hypothetical protein